MKKSILGREKNKYKEPKAGTKRAAWLQPGSEGRVVPVAGEAGGGQSLEQDLGTDRNGAFIWNMKESH